MTDPISDFLTRLRNASKARLAECASPHSKLRESIAAILKAEGYVADHRNDVDARGHKTIVVAIEDRVRHRLYGKIVRQTSRLKAHDEQNSAAVGDRVRVMETRPLSATKRWRLVEILEKAK